MVSYYDLCVNDFDPYLYYSMSDIFRRIEVRNKKDIRIELGKNEKEALKNCQKFINKLLESANVNFLHGDKTMILNEINIGIICDFFENKGENEDKILFRTLKIGYPFNTLDYLESCKIHLFKGKGLTLCGKESGDLAYLVGEKAYCGKCFGTQI